jgi:pyruvate dehydrogenase E1 component alpha subunit
MTHEISGPRLLDLYRQMLLMRRFEERTGMLYQMRKFGGFLHLYIGQEAIAVGAATALRPEDYVFQTYRDHGITLARGMSPEKGMAELFGKDTGCARGLGGSMHFFDAETNFMGGWGIVGGHLALAAGAAFKSKYTADGRVTICFFGEGATNIGGFHEAMSLSGLWKLPIVFVCENNQYAMGTPMSRTSPIEDLTLKAQGYGMAGDHCEGHDVRVTSERIGVAVERARSGGGPTFMEIETYRFRGHSMSDPAKYRTREEVEEEKKRDPLLQAARWILEEGTTSQAQLDEMDEAIKADIQTMVQFAESSEFPGLDRIYTNVLA